MSKYSGGLLSDMLSNRWQSSQITTGAAITAAVGDANSNKEVRHLDFLHIGLLSKNTLSFTVAAQVRDASVGGTILWQQNFFLQGSTTTQVAPAGIHLTATPGKGFFVTTDTTQPSVTAAINAAGWTDDSRN